MSQNNKEILKEAQLVEDEANVEQAVAAAVEDAVDDAAIEVPADKQEEVVDSITNEVEEAQDTLDAAIAPIDLKFDTEPLVRNEITKKLDKCLRAALASKGKNDKDNSNLLIVGLPGSGKTAVVADWASRTTGGSWDYLKNEPITDSEGKKIHMVYLNMKNNDLDAYINGYTAEDHNDGDWVKQKYSHNLDGLDQPNSILFLDEYNRQTKDQIRASVLTLINEHKIVGAGKGGMRDLPNFLFTVAVMNPAIGKYDPGAAPINDAENTRFLQKAYHQNSDRKTAEHYIRNRFLTIAKALADKGQYAKAEKELRIRDLGLHLVTHPDFMFDGEFNDNTIEKIKQALYSRDSSLTDKQIRKEIERAKDDIELDLAKRLNQEHATLFNQRLLTSALNGCQGELGEEVEDFKDWLSTSANLLEETDDMLWSILEGYIVPTRADLFKEAGIIDPKANEETKDAEDADKQTNADNEESVDSKAEAETDDEADVEDDADLWNSINGVDPNSVSAKVKSPVATTQVIDSVLRSWN